MAFAVMVVSLVVVGGNGERDRDENVDRRVSGGGGSLFRVIMVMEVMVAFKGTVVMVMQLMRVERMVSLALTLTVISVRVLMVREQC